MPRTIQSLSPDIASDPRWAAIVARRPEADGRFFYAVRTTGVYCRPSCPSRRPKPENVNLYGTAAEAEKAGFRPCRRCQPAGHSKKEHQANLVAELCRQIEQTETAPSLAELAEKAGLSLFHFHRIFKKITGLTPKAYLAALRSERMRNQLTGGRTVTEAIYEAGYSSSSRFYEQSNRSLGMTPQRYRAGGRDTTIRFAVGQCSLGGILVAATDLGVCAIFLGDDPEILVRELEDRFPQAELIGGDSHFEQLVAKIVGFVERPKLGLDLPLDIRGTAFQQRVWQVLQEIPAGATASYTEIAERIGSSRSVRAVASACAANTLAVAIPCHRVVRRDGGLAGYRWGIERKRILLEREAAE